MDVGSNQEDYYENSNKQKHSEYHIGDDSSPLIIASSKNIFNSLYLSLEDEFPGTDSDTTDNDSSDEDTIQESQSPNCEGKYLPVCKKHNPKVKSLTSFTRCVLGLTNVQTWDDIYMKFGVGKVESGAAKANGKEKV
nr:hypothetical protein [Tanacetum cinerariifolium]